MNNILFDSAERDNLLPLTFTRPVAELRVGIMTIREKWETHLQSKTSTLTRDYLQVKWPIELTTENRFINAAILPTAELVSRILTLQPQQVLKHKDLIVAYVNDSAELTADFTEIELDTAPDYIAYPQDIFSKTAQEIRVDYQLITKGRQSAKIPDAVYTVNSDYIFIEEGAKVQFSSLNAENGPIYIGKNAEIMEGSHIRGPFALGEHAIVKMGARIYGGTSIGPHCKVAGEISNSVLLGYANKGHDGYLGNAVIGEWCNLGADTNNSNLKNNYAEVKLWHYPTERFRLTGLQHCGLVMGDHSKCAINTMFNTGTVIGVSANIFGAGFPRNFIPSFSWGGSQKMITYKPSKVLEVAKEVMSHRQVKLTEADKSILLHIFEITGKYRRF